MKRDFILVAIFLIVFKTVGAIGSTIQTALRREYPWAVMLCWQKPGELERTTLRIIGQLIADCFDQENEPPVTGFRRASG